MHYASKEFDSRLKNIVRYHERLSVGSVHRVDSRGLIIARPRIYNPKFPLKGLLLIVLIGFAFKGLVYANLGETVYENHVAELSAGTTVEKAGAWVMQSDPATEILGRAWSLLGV